MLSAPAVGAVRASPSLGPDLLPGHFAEEAEVQGGGRLDQSHGWAGPLLHILQIVLLEASGSACSSVSPTAREQVIS